MDKMYIMDALRRNARKPLTEKLLVGGIKNLRDAMQYVQKIEEAGGPIRAYSTNSSTSTHSSSSSSSFSKPRTTQVGAATTQPPSSTTSIPVTSSSTSSGTTPQKSKTPETRQEDGSADQFRKLVGQYLILKKLLDEKKCTKCGKSGHNRQNCREGGNQHICWNCGIRGHGLHRCPTPSATSSTPQTSSSSTGTTAVRHVQTTAQTHDVCRRECLCI